MVATSFALNREQTPSPNSSLACDVGRIQELGAQPHVQQLEYSDMELVVAARRAPSSWSRRRLEVSEEDVIEAITVHTAVSRS